MILKIAIIISILLQFISAILAVSMIKKTKYNVSWIFLSIALSVMAFRRVIELEFIFSGEELSENNLLSSWLGTIVSIFFFASILYIKKIFKFINHVEFLRKDQEKRILRAVIQAEEKEKKEFARNLHDGLGPLLSSVKMFLSSLTDIKKTEKEKLILENIENLVNESIIAVKETSNKLSPHILNNFGLLSAVKSFTEKINSTKQLNIVLTSNIQETRFDFNIEVIIYRVVCELITNSIRHAKSNNVTIEIVNENDFLKVFYLDDGIGFDTMKVLSKETSGMGFSNIFSRINSINGQIDVKSEINEGINVKIFVKL